MSDWRLEKNERALARLRKSLPAQFPAQVLTHALARSFIPPMPRLAIDSYWRAHPLRADRLARSLAAKSGAPAGWTWRLRGKGDDELPTSFRAPPAPYREKAFTRGAGHCCVCGQPVYRLGWHIDLWGDGPNGNATWHSVCVAAWRFWNYPREQVKLLRRLQAKRGGSGGRLWKTAEVDHRVPLFEVWRTHREAPWPSLLAYWGAPNLQVINLAVHAEKCSAEAAGRAASRRLATGVESDGQQA